MTRRQRARALAFGSGAALILLAWFLAGGRDGASARASAGAGGKGSGPEGSPASGKGEFARRNPLRILREHPPPAPPPAPTPPPSAAAPPPPPAAPEKPLPVRLAGTIAGGPLGVAMLRSLTTGEELMLGVGGDLGRLLGKEWTGTLLTEVQRNKAVFSRAGKLTVLEVDHGEAGSPTPAVAPGPAPPAGDLEPGSLPPEQVTGIGPPPAGPEGEREMSRAEVDENLRNLGNLITQLSVQPFFQNGQPAGFRVSRIRPGSFIDKLGAQNGDVIQDVNGKPIATIKDAFLLYNSFKVENAVRVKVLRGGTPHVLGYNIR